MEHLARHTGHALDFSPVSVRANPRHTQAVGWAEYIQLRVF
jgi:hypothetical protein